MPSTDSAVAPPRPAFEFRLDRRVRVPIQPSACIAYLHAQGNAGRADHMPLDQIEKGPHVVVVAGSLARMGDETHQIVADTVTVR